MIKQLSRLQFHFLDDVTITDNKKPLTFFTFSLVSFVWF